MFLNQQDLQSLTNRTTCSAQVRVLRAMGIEHKVRPDGSVAVLKDRITKVASDAKSLEHARSLLAHADSRTTDRIYRRKAEVVKPMR